MRKNRKRVCALLLSGLMLLTQLPAVALAEEAVPEDGAIASFEPLDSGIAEQTVLVGTELSELDLPDALAAAVYRVSEDTLVTEDGTLENDAGPEVDSGNIVTTVTTTEEQIPVTWDSTPAYDGDTPDKYVFTADVGGYALSNGVEPPQIAVTVTEKAVEKPVETQPGEPVPCAKTEGCTLADGHEGDCVTLPPAENSLLKTITSWTFADGMLNKGELPLGGVSMDHQVSFDDVVAMLPTQINAEIEGEEGPSIVDLTGWTCDAFRQDGGNWPTTGEYTFAAALPEGYACDPLPTVKVTLGGADFEAEYDGLTITGGTVTQETDGQIKLTENNGNYTISGTWTGTLDNVDFHNHKAVITVPDGVTANISLSDVTIDVSGTGYACAFTVEAMGKANITLDRTNILTSNRFRAGLEVPENAAVMLDGDGSLEATGGYGAGIGGGVGGNGGEITISGGTVTATGGNGAGIGGGEGGYGGNGGEGGKITISGGTVKATGGGGAGIGGGEGGIGGIGGGSGKITISGGTVTATGNGGAGIGGGDGYGSGGEITISGGTVTATGGDGAGIGGASGGDGGKITIRDNAHVTATATDYGAGIGGGGYNGNGGIVKLLGGIIKATGGSGIYSGAGVGGGGSPHGTGTGGEITIEGDVVLFAAGGTGNNPANAIGAGGYSSNDGTIAKNNGVVFEDNTGKVYGSPELPGDLTIPDNSTLTVLGGSTLTVPDGSTLTVPESSTLTISDGSTLTNEGTIENSGTVTVQGTGSFVNNGAVYDYSNGITGSMTGTPAAKVWDGASNKSANDLGVSAGGTILITGSNTGGATLTIDVADVTVTSRGRAVSGPIIMVANGISSLTIRDLDLTARDGQIAIYFASDAALTVEGTCKVTGGAGETGSVAIYDSGDLTVAVGAASLTATGGATTATYNGGHGIFANGALDVNVGHGGSLTAVAGDGGGRGSHALAGRTSVAVRNDGTVLAGGRKVDGKFNKLGITSSGDVTLTGSGTTTAQGVTGIQTGGILTVSGTGTVTAKGTNAGVKFQYGSGGGYQLAGDGTLTAAGVDGGDSSYGILILGDLELAFTGSLTAHGGKGMEGHGMYMYGGLTVSEAPAALNAQPGTGTNGCAIKVLGTTDNQTGYFIPVNTTAPVVWTELGVTPTAPTASPSGGAYGAAQTVTLTCATPGAVIFYTLDGTDPTADGARTYSAPITVPLGGTLKACAAAPGGFFSSVVAETYTQQSGGGSSGGGSGSSYGQRTLTDKPTGVKVEGGQIHDSAVLTVKPGELHKIGDAGCDLLRTAQQAGRVLSVYDVSLSRSFRGNVTVSLPVEGRDGQTLTVAHCIDGKLTLSNVKVTGGFAAVKTDSLSPFAVLGGVYTQEALAASPAENPFADVKETDWFYPAVMYVYQRGLMTGTAADTFAPAEAVTRAQPPVILYRLEGSPAVTVQNPFTDVRPGLWYADGVTWAEGAGLVDGYNATTYGPGDPVTREQLVTILYRYAQYKKWDVSMGENTNILSYTDAFDVSEWAVPAFQWACGAGIIQGDGGRLNPKARATRAQLAQMLQRLLDKYGQSAALPVALPEGSKARRVKVQKGDTLWALARKYNCTLAALVAANPIVKGPDFILPGWELKIP